MGRLISAPSQEGAAKFFGEALIEALAVAAPVVIGMLLINVVVTLAQVGLKPSFKRLKPDFSHLNPMKGIKRMFSPPALWELSKSLMKVTVLALVAWPIASGLAHQLTAGGGTVFSVANGSAFWRKSTYLLDREGTAVASPLVTIIDDPHILRAPGSKPFDGDGLATRKNVLVQNGVLDTVLCDVYSARKLGRRSTGSAGRGVGGNPGPTTSNLILEKGEGTREALLKDTGKGLYVTSMMGFGFNPVTGDFSRGAQGFWIENGELTFPVSEITVSCNFDDLLKRIDRVAEDLDMRSSTACATFRVSHMTVAGTSA